MALLCPFISNLPLEEQNHWLELLSLHIPNINLKLDRDILPQDKKQCRFAIVANPEPSSIHSYPNLIWLQSLWAGVERLVDTLDLHTIKLARLIDPNLANTMAEAVLSWTLYLHRDMPLYIAQQHNKQWHQHTVIRAKQRRVTLLGLGEMGRKSAELLVRHGFTVNGWSASAKSIKGVNCYFGQDGLNDVVGQTDILVCLLPQTQATLKLINDTLLARLPKRSQLINFGRGGIVNHNDLIKHLNQGHIKHAVLDVFEQEPLPSTSELWCHKSITVLPHISAPTSKDSAAFIVASNIKTYMADKTLPACVEPLKGY